MKLLAIIVLGLLWSNSGYSYVMQDLIETLEETKIELDVASVKFLAAWPAHGGGVFYDYLAEIEEEIEPVIDEEHSAWGYFTKDQIPTPITDELRNDVLIALGD